MINNQIGYYKDKTLRVLRLTGEFRFISANSLEAGLSKLQKSNKQEVLLDLSRLTYMDSTILGLIIGFFLNTHREYFSLHKPTIVCDNTVKRFFERINVDTFFIFKPSDSRIEALPFTFIGQDAASKKQLQHKVLQAHEALRSLDTEAGYDEVVQTLTNKS